MQVKARFFSFFLAATVVLLVAQGALAWGAVTHTKLATDLMTQVGLLPAAVAFVLRRHTYSFIFGNIAADVVLAKRLSRIKQFCHHWTTGFELLHSAQEKRDEAFAYGYLCHLAADTVAHGYYVPYQLLVSRTTVNFGHLYWEMRADAALDKQHWQTFRTVMRSDFDAHHQVLRSRLVHALLPYYCNRYIFDGINRTIAARHWRVGVSGLSRKSRWSLCEDKLAAYHAQAQERMRSVLTDLDQSPVLREDPNGNDMLRQVKRLRRQNRILSRRGVSVSLRRMEAAASVAPAVSKEPSE